MENSEKITHVIVTRSPKSMGIGLLLTFLFGPIGMLYATIWGGFLMIVVDILVTFLTFGFGLILTWPLQLLWVAFSIRSYNKKLMKV